MGNVECGKCGLEDGGELKTEGDYRDRINANYSRAYRGNKDDPRSNPYNNSEYKKDEKEVLRDQYQRPMPFNSVYDRNDPYKFDDETADNFQDSTNFYQRSHLTSAIAIEKIDRSAQKQALKNGSGQNRMHRKANYQSVDHTPDLPVDRVGQMYPYSQEVIMTLSKYPNYRLAFPSDLSYKNVEDDGYKLRQ
jgi:hypothetical protein